MRGDIRSLMEDEKQTKKPLPKDAETMIETHLRILRTQGEDALRKYLEGEEQERRKPFSDETQKKPA